MPTYEFFRLTSGKRIAAPGEEHDFDDDLPALEYAKGLANGHAIGVWQGARFVVYVSEHDPRERPQHQEA